MPAFQALNRLSAHELAARIAAGRATATAAVRDCLERIEKTDRRLNAFVRVDREEALEEAGRIDRELAAGRNPGPLAGVPVALKDLFCVKGREVTCCSRILEGFISPYDATVARKLKDAGAVILGSTNMDEFAMGSSTENSARGPARNPWDLERVPGGSSGGSAAALAADQTVAAFGTDTGGSVRQPAAFCGVAGLKPTYGRVSRYGLVAYASSLDQAGPFGKDVEDLALLLEVIAGHDPRDATSAPEPVPRYRDFLQADPASLTLGLPSRDTLKGMDREVAAAFRAAVDTYAALGAKFVEVELSSLEYAVACYYIVSTAEASSNLARFDGIRYGRRAPGVADLLELFEKSRAEGFGEEVKRRVLLGTYVLSAGYYEAYYGRALRIRRLIKNDFDSALAGCDCVILPTAPIPAFRLGEKIDDPLQMYLTDLFTISINLAGVPAVSINCGFTGGGLPVGLQLVAAPFREDNLIRAAALFEGATAHHLKKPALDDR